MQPLHVATVSGDEVRRRSHSTGPLFRELVGEPFAREVLRRDQAALDVPVGHVGLHFVEADRPTVPLHLESEGLPQVVVGAVAPPLRPQDRLAEDVAAVGVDM
eukprot:6551316-Alexandrium_andersonii.AAC.1